jgi:carbonic anhydrase/acetyltransferase-like protein (isoleucine patch superfamily)
LVVGAAVVVAAAVVVGAASVVVAGWVVVAGSVVEATAVVPGAVVVPASVVVPGTVVASAEVVGPVVESVARAVELIPATATLDNPPSIARSATASTVLSVPFILLLPPPGGRLDS